MLEVIDLRVFVEGKEIVKGVSLDVKEGEIAAIMGPNGSGKSSFVNAIMGNPKFKVEGKIMFDGKVLNGLKPNERAKLGLFLGFQYPTEIGGVTISNFLRMALNEVNGKNIPVPEFLKMLKEKAAVVKAEKLVQRHLNEGFSGGEKKKCEILQMLMLEPKIALLDETDSGLDVDALKVVAEGIKKMIKHGMGVLIVTHYNRILKYIVPDKVYVMKDGEIVKSGDRKLAVEVEEKGYE